MKITVKNGYKLSALTLGTVQLGLAYGVNNGRGMPSFEESSELLRTALDSGVVSFDTARDYGESERVLGKFFKNETRERTIITKSKITGIDKSKLRDTLFSHVRESCEKLGLDKIPFLKLHSESMLIEYGDAMIRALEDLKREGLVAGVGVSFSDKSRLGELTDGVDLDCVQLPANMLDYEFISGGGIKRLSDRGIFVFVRSVYLQGLFFKNTDELPEKIRCAKAPLDKLHTLANDAGIGMAEMAFGFMRDTEGIGSLVVGADDPAQLRESVALASAKPLSESLKREISAIASTVDPIVIRPWEWYK